MLTRIEIMNPIRETPFAAVSDSNHGPLRPNPMGSSSNNRKRQMDVDASGTSAAAAAAAVVSPPIPRPKRIRRAQKIYPPMQRPKELDEVTSDDLQPWWMRIQIRDDSSSEPERFNDWREDKGLDQWDREASSMDNGFRSTSFTSVGSSCRSDSTNSIWD